MKTTKLKKKTVFIYKSIKGEKKFLSDPTTDTLTHTVTGHSFV